jgi:acyl carrier protein
MRQELMGIIASVAEVSPNQVEPESLLVDDLGMDSLMLLDLTLNLEKVIKRKIKPEELVAIKTVNDVFDFVEERKM